MARWHRLGLSVLVAACAWNLAQAQILSLPPSAAIACMTPPAAERGLPQYPAAQLERKDGASVRVELAFAGPDAAPAFRLLNENFVSDDFVEAVRTHVDRLRIPCMPAGAEPVRLAQTYVFRPDDGRPVVALPPRDLAAASHDRQRACLTRITPDALPDYPARALREGVQGNFLVRLRFATPSEPPQAEIVAGSTSRHLRAALMDFMPGYRLPCQRGEPVEFDVVFQFRINGGPRVLLQDMTLTRFLGAAREAPPARFDFATMGCPFDLRVTHYQPFKPHAIEQLGEARAERLDFIEWLAGIQLRIDPTTTLAVLGDHFTLSVPCGTLDL